MSAWTRPWHLGKRPALDGIRGIGMVWVVADHSFVPHTRALGPAGLTMFFTLSGFLITSILFEERARTGRTDLRKFFTRRAKRLLPTLWSAALVVLVLAAVLGPAFGTASDVIPAVLYYENWLQAGGEFWSPLRHTWSLAVEEQFYFLWPPILIAAWRWFPRKLLPVALAGGAIVLATVWRQHVFYDLGWWPSYYRFDMHLDAILVGCAFALALKIYGVPQVIDRYPRFFAGLSAVLGLGALAWVFMIGLLPDPARFLIVPRLVPWLTVVIIIGCMGSKWTITQLSWLRFIGVRSYSMYIWQPIVFAAIVVAQWPIPSWAGPTFLVVVACVCALVSYRYIESPWLAYRKTPPEA